jgi:hypothetical protein
VSLSLFINFLKKAEYIPSTFDIHHSLFDIRFGLDCVCKFFFMGKTAGFTGSGPARAKLQTASTANHKIPKHVFAS